ncbi:sulfurtransferase TusA family protein [Alsobacter sp. SYSU M60028]|uniref:Sulfurtransferase TusA family protein n=1 Tax=Alsobacter ponti TaxID=2962936 RepID=A0ABT1L7V0_9HYPH|nr:sulfurtransferase TusA family protein [Alsobacter ponti]MCP8937555.1 sulfurtransferase TusA family protein [Alsobacter ponti]
MSGRSGPAGATSLDLSGKVCPEVVLLVAKAARGLPPGALLHVVSTDPLSRIDIPLMALKAGHELAEGDHEGGAFFFTLRVAARG